jgi:hypothetical protein
MDDDEVADSNIVDKTQVHLLDDAAHLGFGQATGQ